MRHLSSLPLSLGGTPPDGSLFPSLSLSLSFECSKKRMSTARWRSCDRRIGQRIGVGLM
ncbi:uncharacterized protein J3R85_014301 [Psidium guajava]|nr:uncharacterized protein J3R85_014301 [Psidium guajava]